VATIYRLRACSDSGIFAIPYREGCRRRAIRLPDRAIVEGPPPERGCEASDRPDGIFVIGAGGVPATIHHANLGLITGFLPLSGVYLLPSGEVAAVYGAEVIPIGVDTTAAPTN